MPKLPLYKFLAIFFAAVFFVLTPLWSLLFQGPFRWHVQQPAAWQGGLELFVLFCFTYLAISVKNPAIKYLVYFVPVEIFARRHGIDLSIIALYIYVQAIFSVGWAALTKYSCAQYKHEDKLYLSLFIGLCIWLLTIWAISGVGFGSAESIRIIAICVLGCVILFSNSPQLIKVWSPWLSVKKATERVSVALISTLFLALFAKISSATVINYDSMWYGLQLEKSMLGEGSIYANQGLVAMVHYYPKLYESLLIPLAGLGSLSLPMGLGVFIWLGVIFTSYSILRELRTNNSLSILIASLVATIPALGSIAMTTKGDAFSAWLGLLAVLFFLRFLKTKDYLFFLVSISALVFAPLARLSVLPYVTVLAGIFIYYAYKLRNDRKKPDGWLFYFFPLSVLLVVTLVVSRSIYLSGVPFVAPDQLVEIASHFGMTVSYPVGGTPSAGRSTIPIAWGAWSYLFNPANIGILLISWIGNAWIFFPIVAIAVSNTWKKGVVGVKGLFLLVGLLFPFILFSMKVSPSHGADGNYFIYPIACVLILSGLMLNGEFKRYETFISRLILVFAAVSSAVIFVTSDWGPGTRAFDLNFNRIPFELESKSKVVFQDRDRAAVLNYFKTAPKHSRVIGLKAQGEGDNHLGWWLPIRYEPIEIISWSRPEIVNNSLGFERFLLSTKIDYVILPNDNALSNNNVVIYGVVSKLAGENKAIKVLENKKYVIWKITSNPLKYSAKFNETGQVDLALNASSSCVNINNLEVTVKWAFPALKAGIRIEVKSKTSLATLWVEAGSEGSETTGPWVAPGTAFIFRSLADNKRLGRAVINDCVSQPDVTTR